MVYASLMPDKNCSNCAGHTQLNCLKDQFGSKLAKLLQDTVEEARTQVTEHTPEVNGRKISFALELAEHLLWLAASIYTGEGAPGSEAIYELAKAIEEVGYDPDEDEEPTKIDPPGPRLVSDIDVN